MPIAMVLILPLPRSGRVPGFTPGLACDCPPLRRNSQRAASRAGAVASRFSPTAGPPVRSTKTLPSVLQCYEVATNCFAQTQSRGTRGPATSFVPSQSMSSAGSGQRDPDAEIGGGAEHDYSGPDEDSFHRDGAPLSACPGDLLRCWIRSEEHTSELQ